MISLESSDLWKTIRRLARQPGPRHVAVAYVSDDTVFRFRKNDVLLTDASDEAIKGARTSAAVIQRAVDAGAAVYHAPDLHAKVMLFGKTVVVGSQNLSASSQTELEEAAIVTDAPSVRRAASEFLARLRKGARRINEAEANRLSRLPVTRAAASRRRAKESLLEALQNDSELLEDFVFCLWHDHSSFTQREIREQAVKKDIKLPERGQWEHFEDHYGSSSRDRQAIVRAYEGIYRKHDNKKTITLEVEHDADEEAISRFVAVGTEMLVHIDHLPYRRHIISYFKKDSGPPFKLTGPDAKRLRDLLNEGLRRAPQIARSLWRKPGWLVQPSELQSLLQAANRPSSRGTTRRKGAR